MAAAGDSGPAYLEFIVVGRQVKVNAVDAATGIEVSIFGPAGTPEAALRRLALAKLQARLARRAPADGRHPA